MTRRDAIWRGVGAFLLIAAPCCEFFLPADTGGPRGMLTLALLVLTLTGLLLLVRGRKVALVWRIDGSRHRHLPEMIRARRRARLPKRRP